MSFTAPNDLHLTVGRKDQLEEIKEVTNDAFMADAFFKKEEYHLRFTSDDVLRLFEEDDSMFVIATLQDDAGKDYIVGSLHLHIDKSQAAASGKITGHFSAVSVPTKYGKRGIGTALVKYAEKLVIDAASEQRQALALTGGGGGEGGEGGGTDIVCTMEMGVINARHDLFPWYERQGYQRGGPLPHSDELARIILEGQDICCILMSKTL